MRQTNLSRFFSTISETASVIPNAISSNREPTSNKIKITSQKANSVEGYVDGYSLYFDGCSKGNPGLAGAGVVIYKDNVEIWNGAMFVGKYITNNVSEYNGLLLGMTEAARLNIKRITIFGDSNLVIQQMNRIYKIKSQSLLPLFNKAVALERQFEKVTYKHVYREYNTRADELSNIGLSK